MLKQALMETGQSIDKNNLPPYNTSKIFGLVVVPNVDKAGEVEYAVHFGHAGS
ncbi:MAG: hypothetical protein ACYCX4_11985 [Bacillota bacterium]